MALSSRHAARARAVCVLVLVGCSQTAFVSPSVSSKSERACAALQRWARPYAGTRVTLDQLTAYDRAHQLAIFNAISPEVRASLWQEHLRRFSQRADLSASQRALVEEAIPLVTPAVYRHEPAAVRAFDEFWAGAERAFQTVDQRRAWLDLGSTHVSRPATRRSDETYCNCRVGFGECGSGAVCGGGSCTPWGPPGCGWLGKEECNGLCQ